MVVLFICWCFQWVGYGSLLIVQCGFQQGDERRAKGFIVRGSALLRPTEFDMRAFAAGVFRDRPSGQKVFDVRFGVDLAERPDAVRLLCQHHGGEPVVLRDDDVSYCNFVSIRHGSIVAVQTIRLKPGVETTDEELLSRAIVHIVESMNITLSREVIVPMMPSAAILFDGVTFTIPKRGEKSDLLEFSLRSARIYRAEIHKNMEIKNPERHTERLMEAMRKELHLAKQPRHIECFDNSNLQGTNPVASCVVFRDGKPSKREYRHFNVKSVEGPDDFASMREIVHRRYSRLLDEGAELPDLIIVDGGKGQLSSAYAILKELGIENRVPIVGLAKRLEEVYYPDDPTPYYLSRMGEPLKVICHIRDEAHRFGITFHRQKRDKSFIDSELSHIPGIGDKSLTTLLRHFKTVRAVREASREQLTEVVGTKRAEAIINYFGGGDEQK